MSKVTKSDEKSLSDYIDAVRRHKILLGLTIATIFVICTAIAYGLPAVYRSSATILIEQQEIPQNLVRSTVTSYADQRIQVISQRVMTTSNLTSIVDKYDLYAAEREDYPMEVILNGMREDISFEMISADVVDPTSGRAEKATIAFSVAFEHRSAAIAQSIANELVTLYLNENLKNRTQMAQEASQFFNDESAKLEARIGELENQIAAFKEVNSTNLPELSNFNMELVARTERDLFEVQRQLDSLHERKIYLESELLQIDPGQGAVSESGERIMSSADRLKVLEVRLVSLSARYAPDHPDLLEVRKEISALKQQTDGGSGRKEIALRLGNAKSSLGSMLDKYSDDHPDVRAATRLVASLEKELAAYPEDSASAAFEDTPDNPAYIMLKAQLEVVNSDLLAVTRKEQDLRSKLDEYEARFMAAPQVERQYRAMLREYESAQIKYQEVVAKQSEAQMAQSLETESMGERFTLIEPPLLPAKPAKPNRRVIFILGVVLSLGGGVGSVAVIDALDSRVYGRRGIERLFGVPPLVVVPRIDTPEGKARRRRTILYSLAGLFVLMVCLLVIFHNFVRPLDVLWYSILR